MCIISNTSVNSNWSYSRETLNSGQNCQFLVPLNNEIWWIILENNRNTSFILHQALCIIPKPWVNSNWSYSPEALNLGQNRQFLSRVTLKFYGCPWKTIGHIFYSVLKLCASFHSHHGIQTGVTVWKRPMWVKIDVFLSRVTLKFDRWPWKNKRSHLLGFFKLCVSFCSHWWIQIWVTVWKRPIWVQIVKVFNRVTLNVDGWPWKIIGHIF